MPELSSSVAETGPAQIPARIRLEGLRTAIVPLDPELHGDSLYLQTAGPSHEELWRYLFHGPFATRQAFDEYLKKRAASADPLLFAVLDKSSGEAVGHAAYMRIEPAHRVIEVGSILFAPKLQKTAAATEAMYLMAWHAFENLGYRRYEWKCNALNQASRKAAIRLGFQFEGIFRQHMIIKGQNRDTAWYSMLDRDWPLCKAAFELWLDPSNFDAAGRQKDKLEAVRARLQAEDAIHSNVG